MQVRRAVVAQVTHVHAFEDVERLQHHEALRVGRALVDLNAFVVDVDRRVFVGLDRGQVLPIDQASLGLHVGRELLRDRTLVKRRAALGADLAQGGAQILLHHPVAHAERLIAVEPDGFRGRRQFVAAAANRARQRFGDRKAALREFDGRRHQFRHRFRAIGFRGKFRTRDRAGHAHRKNAVLWQPALALVKIDGRGHRRDARAVDELHFAGLGEVDQHEQVTADAGHLGLGETLHGPRRHRGVDGVAAGFQDADARFRREGVARRDHPRVGEHDRAPRRRLRLRGRDDGYEDQCADQADTSHDSNLITAQYRPNACDGNTFRAGSGTRSSQRPLSDSVAAVGCGAC